MLKTRFLVVLVVMVMAAFGVACSSDCEVLCEKSEECLPDVDVDECVDQCEDAVDDGLIDEDDLEECACCVDDNSCGEILDGACDSECSVNVSVGLMWTPAE